MAAEVKILKGYVKTENMILLLVAALALGFIGGVVFSAYRLGGTTSTTNAGGPMPITAQQEDMIASLIEKTRNNPEDVEAWTQLGHLYFDTDQPVKAIDAYEKSLALDASRPDVWTDLGVMHRRNGEPQKAIEAFDKAVSLRNDHQIALYNKGIVLMHDLKDPKGAVAAWEKLLELNPDAKTPAGDSLKNIIEQMRKNESSS
jgi:cytochrome c-type biogenesis protein CcmH/NrfG